ncbi:acetyl-CoA carboxylase biotin carboxylase subunit family protein [Chitinibacter sp. ZOR0017]|uniref:ATP-grasp domain-containing protein n=1 Tax=Chitinibacter sp. ZOR0017 TaxID=1339254 RepID=UPI00069225AB|nr:ATP-grasp domain-containing protein [Chitinibacter sp. ZOR0017]
MSKSSWVLLVGTSFSAVPILHTLQAAGWAVAVCGNHPSDPCVAQADAYYQLDYSNHEQLLALVKREGFGYLCPSCNDYAYLSAAYVANSLGLPGFDAPNNIEVIANKASFRSFAHAAGLPVPRVWQLEFERELIQYPVLVKPVDSFSGRGVTKVLSSLGLDVAIAEAQEESRSQRYVVEQFIEGSLHSHSAFIQEGKIAFDFFVDEYCQAYPYQVDCSHHPSQLPQEARGQLRALIQQMVQSLGLVDGLLHTQFMFSPDGPILIESMRRCPGDLYYHLIHLSTGQAYLQHYVAPFLGQTTRVVPSAVERFWMRHTLSQAKDSIYIGVNTQLDGWKGFKVFPLLEAGQIVKAAPFGKAAIAFIEVSSFAEMVEQTPRLADRFQGSFMSPELGMQLDAGDC